MILAGWRGKKRELGREGNRRGWGKGGLGQELLPVSLKIHIAELVEDYR